MGSSLVPGCFEAYWMVPAKLLPRLLRGRPSPGRPPTFGGRCYRSNGEVAHGSKRTFAETVSQPVAPGPSAQPHQFIVASTVSVGASTPKRVLPVMLLPVRTTPDDRDT